MVVNDQGSQLGRIETAPSRYPVNLRCTIPFYPNPLFVTLIVGREKRGPERLRTERVRHPLDTWGNVICAFCLGVAVSVLVMFLIMVMTGFPAS